MSIVKNDAMLTCCIKFSLDGKCYIELTMKDDVDGKGMSAEIAKRRPRIRCDSESIAQQVCNVFII